MVNWCDTLGSVPSVGLGLDWRFQPSEVVLGALTPMLNPLIENERPTFNVIKADSFNIMVNVDDGYVFSVEPSRIGVSFRHVMRPRAVSGAPPSLEFASSMLPYTSALAEAIQRLSTAALLVVPDRTRKINRLGVVSTTTLEEEDAPPGIMRLLQHMKRPFGGSDEFYSFQMIAKLGEDQEWTEHCIHTVAKPQGDDQLTTVTLDWQRRFKSGKNVAKGQLSDLLNAAKRDAVAYFEEVGEGTRFDAEFDSAED